MIPLVAFIALHPGHSINIAIVSITEVHLRAVVALLVLPIASVTMLAEADLLVCDCVLHFGELSLLMGHDRGLGIAYL